MSRRATRIDAWPIACAERGEPALSGTDYYELRW
jgi:hypothetical protein